MTIAEMLKQCALLAGLGMAIVFAFLWVMIICMNAVAKLIRIMGWNKDIQQSPNGPARQTVTPEITAAVTAAVMEYREKEHHE